MIKIEDVEVMGLRKAIKGMRNPHNSWDNSDSYVCTPAQKKCEECRMETKDCERKGHFIIGKEDMHLIQSLCAAGPDHRKLLRQIAVSMDVIAPFYWWKQFDQFKVGTTTNSCSTMHTIHKREFKREDFSCEHLDELYALDYTIEKLNGWRLKYMKTGNKQYWWSMIQLLPESYNQLRTVTFNYENALSMIQQRSFHTLDEWRDFVAALKDLPYMEQFEAKMK